MPTWIVGSPGPVLFNRIPEQFYRETKQKIGLLGGNRMLKRVLAVLSVGLLAVALFLPFLQVQSPVSAAAPLVSSSTRFRVVIAENLAASANIYLDSTIVDITPSPTATPVPTPSAMVVAPFDASGYVTTTAGSHTITLTQNGNTTAFTGVSPFTFNPVAGTNYTIVLLPGNSWITIVDGNTAPAVGTANARILNFSSINNPAAVDVDGVAPAAFTGVLYQTTNSTASVYGNITAVLHTLTIPGSNANAKAYTFQSGHVYSIFIFDNTVTNKTVILPKSDALFVTAATPTVIVPTATNTPLPTATNTTVPTSTATIVPTVGSTVIPTVGATTTVTPGSMKLFMPIVDH
jgi:hypothetical protein